MDCKFYIHPTGDFSKTRDARLGKCGLFPYADQKTITLVAGMDEPIGMRYRFATAARMNEAMCGIDAVNFVPRPWAKAFPKAK